MRLPVRHPTPPASPPPSRLSSRNLLMEIGGIRDVMRMSRYAFRPPANNDLRGLNVILIPGWQAPEASMEPIRRYLKRLGANAQHWGLGTNRGQPEMDRDLLLDRIEQMRSDMTGPLVLLGWSLGGVIAREIAREAPELIERVITFGTPVIGGPSYTAAAGAFGDAECERITELSQQLDAEQPIEVPLSLIFTRRDGVVSWPACIDRNSPDVTHFEVGSTHLSMGIDPDVWQIIASEMALCHSDA